MAPSQPSMHNSPAAIAEDGQALQAGQSVQLQPVPSEPMNPERPHVESQESTVGLRGGHRGGLCPGRFCFIIPCPIPCDCCVIPL